MIEKGIDRIDKPTSYSLLKELRIRVTDLQMENNLSNLATISGAAPMIGFLGTVIGMILAFHQMASSEVISMLRCYLREYTLQWLQLLLV